MTSRSIALNQHLSDYFDKQMNFQEILCNGDVGLCLLNIVSDVCLNIQAPMAQWLRHRSRKPKISGWILGRAHFAFSLHYLPMAKQLKSNIYLNSLFAIMHLQASTDQCKNIIQIFWRKIEGPSWGSWNGLFKYVITNSILPHQFMHMTYQQGGESSDVTTNQKFA